MIAQCRQQCIWECDCDCEGFCYCAFLAGSN